VGALGTPTHTAVLDFLKQNKVPDLFVSSGSLSWNQPEKYPTTFGWQPDYTVEGKILGDYIKKNFAGKKVCSFGQGDDFGADGVKGVELTLGAGSLASKQTYTPTNTNVAPQIGALKQAGCQVVTSFTVPGFTALALGTAAKIKFAPQWVISNVGSDVTTLTGYLKEATGPLLEGAISDAYLPLPQDTSNSWIALFQKVDQQYDDNAVFDGNVEYGMALAYTTVQALKAAGKDLNRGDLIAAVEKGGFTGPGLVPFRFSSDDHSGYAGTQIVQITGGKPKTVGPVYTTDDGNGPLQEVTATPPDAPANGLPE
jgi:ABC-type branched-subunit amino acid transport system substrate-binding protein